MQLTMLANRAYQIWVNMPVPVAGTTMSDCYPSQYMTSYLLSAGGVTQPAFNPLVCPENWSTQGVFTSNYIACCPRYELRRVNESKPRLIVNSGYGLAAPTVSVLSDRPAFGGTCYSDLTSGSSYLMTQYGSSSVTQTTYFPATTTGMQAYAYPIDGFAYGVNELQSQASTTTAVTASASTAAASSTSNTGATYTVILPVVYFSIMLTGNRSSPIARQRSPHPVLQQKSTTLSSFSLMQAITQQHSLLLTILVRHYPEGTTRVSK